MGNWSRARRSPGGRPPRPAGQGPDHGGPAGRRARSQRAHGPPGPRGPRPGRHSRLLTTRPRRRLGARGRRPHRLERPECRRGSGPLPHRRPVRRHAGGAEQRCASSCRPSPRPSASRPRRRPALSSSTRPDGTTACPAAPDHLDALQRAVIEGVQVELDYRGRDGRASSRTVHPLGLVVKNNTVVPGGGDRSGAADLPGQSRAVPPTHQGTGDPPRRLRPGRGLAFDRHDGGPPRERRSGCTCAPNRSSSMSCAMCSATGSASVRRRPDGRVEVELRAQSELMVARQLAGFGDRLEVRAPESLRRHLADIGRGLLRAHA